MRLGISKKLFLFFSVFILIFYGTVFDLFITVRDMSNTSAGIVGINNRIAVLSENLSDSLADMDVNDKKFRLLKKESYFEGYEAARKAYNRDLNEIMGLVPILPPEPDLWREIKQTYGTYTLYRSKEAVMSNAPPWGDEARISNWMASISKARKINEDQIEKALLQINNLSRQIVKNGMVGFGISIIVGLCGVVFISRSMLSPLNKLKTGLNQVSNDNYAHEIEIFSNDEFEELATTFNDMSRQLKADEEIRSDFIACLSHEIRTPLSSVRESVSMIIEEVLGPVNEKQKKFLKIANSEIIRITSLLNHLLDTSMLGQGANDIQPKPLDPNHLAQDAVNRLVSIAKTRQVSLAFTPLPQAPRVAGEKKQIIQVLLNIMDNAVKFSPQDGQVDIKIEKPGIPGKLTFKISDQGPGIPEDKQSLIFKKYYRAKEIRQHMDGVGLGLNISKRIIQAHGGKIMVHNNPDRGCTFSFTLPIHKKKMPA
ncbi:MAG: HAMP domain-containing histidine kinase [Desulfobacterales bacterium]|nr:HAMP domain-containing histidine kinase [Desulfobacterales bacterium]